MFSLVRTWLPCLRRWKGKVCGVWEQKKGGRSRWGDWWRCESHTIAVKVVFHPWSRVISFAAAYAFSLGFLVSWPRGHVWICWMCMRSRKAGRTLETDWVGFRFYSAPCFVTVAYLTWSDFRILTWHELLWELNEMRYLCIMTGI